MPSDALFEYSQKQNQRLGDLEAELAKVKSEKERVQAENKAIGEHIFGLQQENGMLHDMGMNSFLEKAHLSKTASEVGPLREQLQAQAQQAQYLQNENAKLKAAIEALQVERAQALHAAKSMEVTLESVRSDLAGRIDREGSLNTTVAALQRQVEELTGEKGRLDRMVSGQHIELAKAQKVFQELHAQKAHCHGLSQKLEVATAEVSRLHQEKRALDQTVSSLHVQVAQLLAQRDSALTEMPSLNNIVQQQQVTMADLQEQLKASQIALQGSRQRCGHLEREVAAVSHMLEEQKNRSLVSEKATAILASERDRLRSAIDDVSCRSVATGQQLGAALGERRALQTQLEATGAEGAQLQLRLQRTTAENSALQSRLAGLERLAQGHKDEAAALQQRLSNLQAEHDQLRGARNAQAEQDQSRGARGGQPLSTSGQRATSFASAGGGSLSGGAL